MDRSITWKIIMDFIRTARSQEGVGLYKGDEDAHGSAREMGKNQVKKFKLHHEVPKAFRQYLKKSEILPKKQDLTTKKWVEEDLTEELILELLWKCLKYNDLSDEDRLWASSIRKRLQVQLDPELKKAMAGQEGFWEKLELYGRPARQKGAYDHRIVERS
jgi:hypothetical protein